MEITVAQRIFGRQEIQATTRMSVTLPSPLHIELERIARDRKVSSAWVMRESAEKYVAEQWPLLVKST